VNAVSKGRLTASRSEMADKTFTSNAARVAGLGRIYFSFALYSLYYGVIVAATVHGIH